MVVMKKRDDIKNIERVLPSNLNALLGHSAFLASWYKNYVESLCGPLKNVECPRDTPHFWWAGTKTNYVESLCRPQKCRVSQGHSAKMSLWYKNWVELPWKGHFLRSVPWVRRPYCINIMKGGACAWLPSIRWPTLHHDTNNGICRNFIGPNTHGTLVFALIVWWQHIWRSFIMVYSKINHVQDQTFCCQSTRLKWNSTHSIYGAKILSFTKILSFWPIFWF
jgi:hypothetical protein